MNDIAIKVKKCKVCNLIKDYSDYYKTKTGTKGTCKSCLKERKNYNPIPYKKQIKSYFEPGAYDRLEEYLNNLIIKIKNTRK